MSVKYIFFVYIHIFLCIVHKNLCIYTFSEYWLFICVLYIKICVYTQFLRYVFLHRIVYIHNFLCTIHNLKCIVHNSHIFVIPTLVYFVRCKRVWWTWCCVRRASGKKYRITYYCILILPFSRYNILYVFSSQK